MPRIAIHTCQLADRLWARLGKTQKKTGQTEKRSGAGSEKSVLRLARSSPRIVTIQNPYISNI